MIFYDLDDNPVSSNFLTVPVSGSKTITIKLDCLAGLELSLAPVPDLTIEAKQEDELTYTDITSGSLDLGTWAGTRETFLIRITAGAVAPYQSREVQFT